MRTYLFRWNPRKSPWPTLGAEVDRIHGGRELKRRWSCGNARSISRGDQVFLLRTGSEPRGIMGSGVVTRPSYPDSHWDPDRKALGDQAYFVDIRFDALLHPEREALLTLEDIPTSHLVSPYWRMRASGVTIPPPIARGLRKTWTAFLASRRRPPRESRPDRPVARRSSPGKLPPAVFAEALETARTRITKAQWRMLQAHFLAPDHTITTLELAVAAGFRGDNHSAVNLHYGRLGSLLRQASDTLGALQGQQSHVVATFLAPVEAHARWRLQMHRPLSKALTRLGWFADDPEGALPSDTWPKTATEGELRQRLIWHRSRERSLRWAKLRQARALHPEGRLVCQVPGCAFDFEAMYGEIGRGFGEVHHLLPLSEPIHARETRLQDLVVVCANCHRMIHRAGECRPLDGLIASRTAFS